MVYFHDEVVEKIDLHMLKATESICSALGFKLGKSSGAPNENIVQNHLNVALLNVF